MSIKGSEDTHTDYSLDSKKT